MIEPNFPRSGADEPQSETPKVPAVNVRQPGEGLGAVDDGAEPLALSSGDNTQADNHLPHRSRLAAGLIEMVAPFGITGYEPGSVVVDTINAVVSENTGGDSSKSPPCRH